MILHWAEGENMVSLPLARVVVSEEMKVTHNIESRSPTEKEHCFFAGHSG